MTFKTLWGHNEVLKRFRATHFIGTIKPFNLKGDQKQFRVLKKEEKDEKGNTIKDYVTYNGWEFKSDEQGDIKTYFIEQDLIKKMPFRIKETEQVVYRGKVYEVVKVISPVKIPANDALETDDWFINWAKIKHTNPDDQEVLKLSVLTCMIFQAWTRNWSKAGTGKDSIVNSVSSLTNFGRKVSVVSDAKLFQLSTERYTAFNEMAGLNKEDGSRMGKFFLQTSDGNDEYEHGSTGSDKTGNKSDISEYGYNIFHNIPSYYTTKGKNTFEDIVSPAVINRILPLSITGAIADDNEFVGLVGVNYNDLYKEAEGYWRRWASKFAWMQENASTFVLSYSLDKYDLSDEDIDEMTSRWMNTFTKMAVLAEQIAKSRFKDTPKKIEQEFYRMMDNVFKCHKRAVTDMKDEGLVGV